MAMPAAALGRFAVGSKGYFNDIFDCPKSIRNCEKNNAWLMFVCPIDPANQHIILKIVGFQRTYI